MAVQDIFGIADAVKRLSAPIGMEAVHQDGMSWAKDGERWEDTTKWSAQDVNRIIGNLRRLIVASGVDLSTLDPGSPDLLLNAVKAAAGVTLIPSRVEKAANYTAVLADRNRHLRFTASATLALAPAAAVGEGFSVWVSTAAGATVTIDPDGLEQVSSGLTHVLPPNRHIILYVSGGAWHTLLQQSSKLAASTAAEASLNMPAGAAPTAPVDGDAWSTGSAWYVRLNGVTQTVATVAGTVARTGDVLDMTGNKRTSGDFQTTNEFGFKQQISGGIGTAIRNDGTAWYLMVLDNSSFSNSFSALRPITVNLSSGGVTFGNTVSIGGNLNLSANASSALQAVPKQQLDAAIAAIASSAPADAILADRKASGTDGQLVSAGAWVQRELGTELKDPNNLISLGSNRFTATVNGEVQWETVAGELGQFRTRLWNVTDGVEVAVGLAIRAGANTNVPSSGRGSITAGKTYEIQMRVQSSGICGQAAGFGVAEIYTLVYFWRAA